MFTCKDCVHYNVCGYHIDEETFMTTEECSHFKNKADFVEVKKVAEMLNDLFGDKCPCNYNDIDEWLPYCCEHANTCDCPCEDGWVQFIKHYDKRKEGADNG